MMSEGVPLAFAFGIGVGIFLGMLVSSLLRRLK